MRVEPIDLRPFREGDDSDRQRVAEQFDHAARTSGFLSVGGHGVDPGLTTRMPDVTAAFFDLDPHEKMAYFAEDRSANRGYAPEGSEALAYSLGEQVLPTDLFEAFDAGLELTAADLADPQPNQMRMGAHTDNGSITVLLADPVPGLQICDGEGRWHDVVPSPGSFVVNVGDLLAEWSNDRWWSTLHRREQGRIVVPSPGTTDGPVRRRSVAWFQQPNWDAVIECLPTCADESNPPRYAPVTSGDFR